MAKVTASHRLDESLLAWIDENAAHLGVTKSSLIEDALRHAARTINGAADNLEHLYRELAARYGESAELVTWLTEEDGEARVQLRINGQEPEDLHGSVSRDPQAKVAHVFLTLDGADWATHGTYHIGPNVYATTPMCASVALPWPPDPLHSTAAVATLGQILHGGARPPARELAEL